MTKREKKESMKVKAGPPTRIMDKATREEDAQMVSASRLPLTTAQHRALRCALG